MEALSVSTQIPDAYRAGVYLGEHLAALNPEVVFLFTSIDYGHNSDILVGLQDSLNQPNCIIIGNSGDGFYETHGVGEYGAAALALNSHGQVQWQLKIGHHVTEQPQQATRTALQEHQQASLIFMISDFHADASLIEEVIEHEIKTPIVGGFAADDQQWDQCALYTCDGVINDCVIALHAIGNINFSIFVDNSITPIGHSGTIEQAESNRIDRIGGMDAMRFIEQETGKPILRSDRGNISLTIINHENFKRLRSIKSDIGENAQSIFLYGGISTGQKVQVCIARPDEIIHEVYQLAQQAQSASFQPIAALIISCAGRKSLLGTQLNHEIDAITKNFQQISLIGFPSLGEIAPLRLKDGYSANLFHNMTYVLVLIGL